ncbi:hypothetical protein WJX73_007860 [Symbiochloris irregularis]|uniref:Nuclear cap-binding protein subunit 2 n=1 Tax=Symbiochloris irregularis TaxID=706552 RepID=A0AAW1NZN4_9CHLO
MARLLKLLDPAISQYRDRRFTGSQEAFEERLRTSTTLYIGNLSFFTTEEQIYEVFSRAGPVKRIIMGLDKMKRTPCGFCFVLYHLREDADTAVKYLSGLKLDDRPIRVDFDWGFEDGRQFGRGRGGGQVRDEYRTDWDAERGGFGNIVKAEMARRQAEMEANMALYNQGQDEDVGPYAKRQRRRGSDEED